MIDSIFQGGSTLSVHEHSTVSRLVFKNILEFSALIEAHIVAQNEQTSQIDLFVHSVPLYVLL